MDELRQHVVDAADDTTYLVYQQAEDPSRQGMMANNGVSELATLKIGEQGLYMAG